MGKQGKKNQMIFMKNIMRTSNNQSSISNKEGYKIFLVLIIIRIQLKQV